MRAITLLIPLVVSLLLTVGCFQVAYAQELPAPEALTLTVYPDGVVHVDYLVAVDPESSKVDVKLFGETFENLYVTDEEGMPLENDIVDNTLGVTTLGASRIHIAYDSPDLTSKTGRYWTLTVEAPVATTVILPPEAVIISLSTIPESIESRKGQTILIMPQGSIEITYTISVAGTKEHALALIREAESKISEAKNAGVNVEEAESLLSKAKEAFNAGNYTQAEVYAKEATTLAQEALITATTPPPTTTTPPSTPTTTTPSPTTTPSLTPVSYTHLTLPTTERV